MFKQDKEIAFIFYELDICLRDFNINFILKDCLLGAVKVTQIGDPDKSSYCGYGTRFDSDFF